MITEGPLYSLHSFCIVSARGFYAYKDKMTVVVVQVAMY